MHAIPYMLRISLPLGSSEEIVLAVLEVFACSCHQVRDARVAVPRETAAQQTRLNEEYNKIVSYVVI